MPDVWVSWLRAFLWQLSDVGPFFVLPSAGRPFSVTGGRGQGSPGRQGLVTSSMLRKLWGSLWINVFC